MRVEPATTPGGLIPIQQLLDESVNKMFKDYVRRFYSEWMAAGPHNLTLTRNIWKLLLEIICKCIIWA
jgi:hypothetical protein